MAPIVTYVFLDLETTGIPREENNKTKITELSMVVVKRDHVLDSRPGAAPRVQHKLTLCFNPGRFVHPISTEVTGLSNDLLEHEPYFDKDTFNMINTFLNMLTKPVCLIAQNGFAFDFPILKNHLDKLKVSFSEDLYCADCYHAFYDIMEAAKRSASQKETLTVKYDSPNSRDETDLYSMANTLTMKMKNETTPKQNKESTVVSAPRKDNKISKVRRKFPWSEGSKPTESYKLKDIYERLLNRPAIEAHRAENDCVIALECSVVLAKDFVTWIDDNHISFADVKPMTIGVPLGD